MTGPQVTAIEGAVFDGLADEREGNGHHGNDGEDKYFGFHSGKWLNELVTAFAGELALVSRDIVARTDVFICTGGQGGEYDRRDREGAEHVSHRSFVFLVFRKK